MPYCKAIAYICPGPPPTTGSPARRFGGHHDRSRDIDVTERTLDQTFPLTGPDGAGFLPGAVQFALGSLDGVESRLRDGITVADVGCGLGASTVIMAQAYPKSTFVGSDHHVGSIDLARTRAENAGVADRVRFESGSSRLVRWRTVRPGDHLRLLARPG